MSGRTHISAEGGCRSVGDVRHHRQAGQIDLRVTISVKHLVPACMQGHCLTPAVAVRSCTMCLSARSCCKEAVSKSQQSMAVHTDKMLVHICLAGQTTIRFTSWVITHEGSQHSNPMKGSIQCIGNADHHSMQSVQGARLRHMLT